MARVDELVLGLVAAGYDRRQLIAERARWRLRTFGLPHLDDDHHVARSLQRLRAAGKVTATGRNTGRTRWVAA